MPVNSYEKHFSTKNMYVNVQNSMRKYKIIK